MAIPVPQYGSVNPDGSVNLYDPNTGQPLTPPSVTQGTTFVDTGGRTGTALYDPNTGKLLSAGQTVTVQPVTQTSTPQQTQPTQTTTTPTSISVDPALSQVGIRPFSQDTVINGVTIPAGSYKDENNKPVSYPTNVSGQRVLAVEPSSNTYYVAIYDRIGKYVNGSYVGYVNSIPTTAKDVTKTQAGQPPAGTGTTQAQSGQTQAGTTGPASTQPTAQYPTTALQPGSTGEAVKQLQDYLVSVGKMTQAQVNTGYGTYGPQTTAAVLSLQKELGIDYSTGPGYFGPRTIAALKTTQGNTTTTGTYNPSGLTTNNQSTNSQTGTNIAGVGGTGTTGGTTGATNGSTTGDTTTSTTDPYEGLDPIAKQIKMYEDAYKALGIGDIKTQYTKTLSDIKSVQDELQNKILDINNNPWLSEGIRTVQIKKLQDSYQTRLDTLTNLEQLYDSQYKQGNAQVETIVSNANLDQKAINELAQKRLDAATALAKDNSVQSVGGRELLINNTTGKVIADLGPTTHFASASSGTGTSNQQTDNERALFSQFNGEQIVKDYNTILAKKLSVDQILSQPLGGPGDLASVYEFMKALDPSSVVRESEYQSAASSGNIFAGALAQFNGYLKPNGGFLPAAVKSSFQQIINSKLKVQEVLFNNLVTQYQGIAQRQGLNPQNVVANYSAANTTNTPSTQGQQFADILPFIKDGPDNKSYLPRQYWTLLGARQDALLKYLKDDGVTLLIT